MEKKKVSVILPVIWSITAVICILTIMLRVLPLGQSFSVERVFGIIMAGLNALLSIVCAILYWIRYKKDKKNSNEIREDGKE